MNRSGHVVFVINSLVGGGAERALMNVVAGLEGHLSHCRVSLVLLDDLPEKHAVPAYVEKHVLAARESMGRSLVQLFRKLRELKPDVVVSFLSRANCANVAAAGLLGYAAIISERVHTTSHFGAGASLQKAMIRWFYGRAAAVLAVSSGVGRDLVANFGVPAAKVAVIHNPIGLAKLRGLADSPGAKGWTGRYAVAVGRLVPNKNMAMLLKGFARSNNPDRLVILGEGPERPGLERLARELGIADRVDMPGYVDNPYRAMAGARFLVSASNAEGFPNAIVEAMALGVPVIATDCESGPADVLSPGVLPATDAVTVAANGVLVPVGRDDLMAEAITLLADEDRLAAYRAAGLRRVADFAPAHICGQYWRAIAAHLPALAPDAASATPADRTQKADAA